MAECKQCPKEISKKKYCFVCVLDGAILCSHKCAIEYLQANYAASIDACEPLQLYIEQVSTQDIGLREEVE